MLWLAVLAVVMTGSNAASAAQTPVAVAANFTEPGKQIATAFKAQTGHTAVLTFGSSGEFYAQIAHGAPYEVFLSADADRPKRAEQEGLASRVRALPTPSAVSRSIRGRPAWSIPRGRC